MRDLDLLGTFLEVHRRRSITAAAAALGLSQPAVSERLARLEAQLGAPLFTRSSRGVTATLEGDRLAARVGEPVDRLREVWAQDDDGTVGVVRIGGASDVVASRVVPALAPLTRRGVVLRFTLGLAPDLLDALGRGELDLVVSSIRPTSATIRSRGLIDEEFVLVGAPSLAATVDRDLLQTSPATALAHLPLVAYDEQLSIVRRYWRSQFGHRPANTLSVVVPDLRGVLAGVIAGAGISAVPRYLADPAVANGSVEVLHRPLEAPINTLHLAIAADRAPDAPTTAVIDRLLEQARTWDVF
ncbi:DNA-binding transcriptional LysR family regulator [Diaminobutyricimonas aerilata]|uniref:DNA-binding transcriptional LysR family regulator n=1 Tax=Diaminobutyricimonas aerilata TaxID=1162967 RepID=A0A2M9CNW4_9MICO|nr:LysR family transcriptional regulator [Diaminobutyricimonas aerilata]PJJ73587.1 DNA-binding transcriptional LysR family regulator [Diaminobutyricimonas aerilata]